MSMNMMSLSEPGLRPTAAVASAPGQQDPNVPLQMVLFTDDSLGIIYTNGSKLTISPCGATFTYTEVQNAETHPLASEKSTQHRTQFATSSYKLKVTEGLNFRNMFAERPFVFKDLWTKCSILRLHADVTEVSWPANFETGLINRLPDGSTVIKSLNEYASVTLASHKQSFTFRYLGKIGLTSSKSDRSGTLAVKFDHFLNSSCAKHVEIVSPKKKQDSEQMFNTSGLSVSEINESHVVASSPLTERTRSRIDKHDKSENEINADLNDLTLADEPSKASTMNTGIIGEGFWDYVWIDQHFSLQEYPEELIPVINFLLKYHSSKPDIEATNKSKKESKIKTILPKTLPLNCSAQHLHQKFNQKPILLDPQQQSGIQEFTKRPKVVCIQGVLYRLLWGSPRGVEILPGDGSLIRSSSLSGHFFHHYKWADGHIEERTYSVENLPPTVLGFKYSIEKLITRGARFLDLLYNQEIESVETGSVCWKVSTHISQVPETFLLEECNVENIGRFSAYSSGRIRILFLNRICLEMWYDLSNRLHKCSSHGNVNRNMKHCNIYPPSDLAGGVVRLLLPHGHYQTVPITEPGNFSYYVSAALHWAAWVNSQPSERFDFYKDTIHDPAKVLSIEQELKKINCFNYLLDSGVMPHFSNATTETWRYVHKTDQAHTPDQFATDTQTACSGSRTDKDTFDFCSVQQVLQQNSNAVKDIDSFLELKHK